MRAIIVTGDRHAKDEPWGNIVHGAIEAVVTKFAPFVLIHGNADGIDQLAQESGEHILGVSLVPVPAQWKKLGNPAGPKRNTAMLSMLLTLRDHGYDVRVYAFHDSLETSKGTKDMVRQARKAGVMVRLFRSDGTSEVVG